MRIKYESELLNESVRAKIIEEIEGSENLRRKWKAYKRYQCYKDKTNHFVMELLLRQFDTTTVEEMMYALSNISIVKKVIDKLSRVYSNGVERSITDDEESTKKLKELEKKLDLNSAMKKVNRFLKLQNNVDLFIKPCPQYDTDGKVVKWYPKLEVLNPFLYDVVEDFNDREKPLCVILSDYTPPATSYFVNENRTSPIPATAAIAGQTPLTSDGKDNIIADSSKDQKNATTEAGNKTYVFWTKNYHFTTDNKGVIIPDAGNPANVNPLKLFNHISFAKDQDGSFWAEGGEDLIDGAVLINAVITHTTHVGTLQGYGQFYMTGENLPRSLKIGPTKAIVAEYKKDEQAEPKMGFLNANPQLDSLKGLVEMYIALYLTTNNLSTSGVATQLSGGQTLASGVAMILDKAESLEDVQDQRQVFLDKEPDAIEAINATLVTFGDSNLTDEFKNLELKQGWKDKYNLKFHDQVPILSEKEKLENLKIRRELGIDTMISLLMKDDPSLSEDQAESKLEKLLEQKIKETVLTNKLAKENGVEYADETEESDDSIATQDDQSGKPEDDEAPQGQPQSAAPSVGDSGNNEDVQKLALNGAQVTSLVEIVEKVAAGTIPRESAVKMLVVAFNISEADANNLIGEAGRGFKPAQEQPVNNNNLYQDNEDESDRQDDQQL